MKAAILAALAAFAIPAFVHGQSQPPRQFSEEEKQAFADAADLMAQCEISRKAGRLDQAERQCLAAIQLYESVGWHAQGYAAKLGMIYYEEGKKRLGFVTMRDAWRSLPGGEEAELYLGRIAIEVKEYKTAWEVLQRFRSGRSGVNEPLSETTRPYWPTGDDVQTVQATLEFLEGERLYRQLYEQPDEKVKQKGLELLRHADELCPNNVAICYAVGRALAQGTGGLAPAPYYRVVSQQATGRMKREADGWLAGHAQQLQAAESAKGR
jgi:tetratricopeptide (TPR) repeat protein